MEQIENLKFCENLKFLVLAKVFIPIL